MKKKVLTRQRNWYRLENSWLRQKACELVPSKTKGGARKCGGRGEFARKNNLSPQQLSMFLSGRRKVVSFGFAINLASAMGIDLSELQIIVRKRQQSEKGK